MASLYITTKYFDSSSLLKGILHCAKFNLLSLSFIKKTKFTKNFPFFSYVSILLILSFKNPSNINPPILFLKTKTASFFSSSFFLVVFVSTLMNPSPLHIYFFQFYLTKIFFQFFSYIFLYIYHYHPHQY